jgi:hypothetical protein
MKTLFTMVRMISAKPAVDAAAMPMHTRAMAYRPRKLTEIFRYQAPNHDKAAFCRNPFNLQFCHEDS